MIVNNISTTVPHPLREVTRYMIAGLVISIIAMVAAAALHQLAFLIFSSTSAILFSVAIKKSQSHIKIELSFNPRIFVERGSCTCTGETVTSGPPTLLQSSLQVPMRPATPANQFVERPPLQIDQSMTDLQIKVFQDK